MTLALTIVLAVGIGISLGLLGGGGSILAVPLLVYVADLPAKEAIATSLLVVGTTSAVAVIPHARAHRVRWRTGLIFGAAGMTGAYAGGRLAAYIPGTLLLAGFALMMLATSVAMIRGRRPKPGKPVPHELPVLHVIADGIVVGLVTGLVGAGGGFLVVPALALLGGLPMPVAVGTSLLVIAMKSYAGLAGYLSTVHINWPLAVAVTAAAVLGSLVGGRLAGRIPEPVLRKTFGWFVAVMGVFVLAQQSPTGLLTSPILWAAVAVLVVAGGIWAFARRRSVSRPDIPGAARRDESPGVPSADHQRAPR
ncbi:MAG: sulfite exporter TauE/SafE family protein [Actinomycetota bacterium]|nr:sulfite exporter TauE/SafE family protein [Actinomycetota bacterium]